MLISLTKMTILNREGFRLDDLKAKSAVDLCPFYMDLLPYIDLRCIQHDKRQVANIMESKPEGFPMPVLARPFVEHPLVLLRVLICQKIGHQMSQHPQAMNQIEGHVL